MTTFEYIQTNGIELLAAMLTVASAGLATVGKRATWGIGILSSLLYAIVFFDVKLWGMIALQFLMIAQSVGGHHAWKLLRIKSLRASRLLTGFTAFTFLFVPVGCMLYADDFTWIELGVCWLSLLANWMLVEGDPRNWKVWILVNAISIVLFSVSKWMPISAITYTILLINSIIASWKWNHLKENCGKTVFS